MNILGYFHGIDPAASVMVDGEVTAYVEEERLLRNKHAANTFPIRSIASCLELSGLELADIDAITYGWDAPRYGGGGMAAFYDKLNAENEPDPATRAWQQRNLALFRPENLRRTLVDHLVHHFGVSPEQVPPLKFFPHHFSHAAAAFFLSDHEEALVLSIDGSGDSDCTTVWAGRGTSLELLHTVEIPNSLGWFYAAITEYLGFEAYDGEYKVMGLAAYGRENLEVRGKLEQIVRQGPNGFDYLVDPSFIHRGQHTYSGRFTDALPELLGQSPRLGPTKITPWHEDVAFETQRLLEETVLRLVTHFAETTGLRTLCVGGGVGLNGKMNSRLQQLHLFDAVSAFPIPSDSGLSLGANAALYVQETGKRPVPMNHLYLGPGFDDDEAELNLQQCGLAYTRVDDVAEEVSKLLADGKVVGWMQGRMEGGPRALGGRSILADPRSVEARDRVNSAVKFREYWRPFCPSLTEESADRYLRKPADAPFMILAFPATEVAQLSVPAVVHVDNTLRVQTVSRETNQRYHDLLTAFERRTGVPVLLNTSFNVKGEAIVCTPRDAIRTFYATGIDALVVGQCIVHKPVAPVPVQLSDANH